MNRHVYNLSILAGVVLVSVGAGMVYVPAGLITAGVLVLDSQGLVLVAPSIARIAETQSAPERAGDTDRKSVV